MTESTRTSGEVSIQNDHLAWTALNAQQSCSKHQGSGSMVPPLMPVLDLRQMSHEVRRKIHFTQR